jgi:hypothetical protein
MVVKIYGSFGTQWITGGHLRVVEEVLYGDLFAWGVLMHTRMVSQVNRCRRVDYDDFSFESSLVARFLERVPLFHHQILLALASQQEPRLMWWVYVLAQHAGGEGGH